MAEFEVYTDGSCRTNTGKGGWGAVILQNSEVVQQVSGSEEHTTNNRMELSAAIHALSQLTCLSDLEIKVTVYSDSQYLCRGMNEWVKGWKKRDWKMVNGQSMKNADLWQRLDDLNTVLIVKWKWVRGHNGDKYNEMADSLAQEASQEDE